MGGEGVEATLRCAFGLALDAAIPLPGDWRMPSAGLPVLRIREVSGAGLDAAWSGPRADGWDGLVDGRAFRVVHGVEGDLRMELAGAAVLHLSRARDELLLTVRPGERLAALRVLLDSALFTVSLATGREALHAGAVALDGRLVAVTGSGGAGKSTLVQALLDSGGTFVTDDVLVLDHDHGAIVGHPGPPVLTLPEHAAAPAGSRLVGAVGDERWLAVKGADRALPLVAVLALDAPGAGGQPAWQVYLAGLLSFPKTAERERTRFALAADLAEHVPLVRVAARSEPPARSTQKLLAALDAGLLEAAT